MPIPIFLIPVVSGLIAQALKPLFNHEWYATIDATGRKMPRYGGMPSAHTSFVVSLVTVVAFQDGIMSTTFAVSASMLLLILDDALRMRIFLGRYGLTLYRLVSKLPPAERNTFPYIEQRLGHRPREVIAGALIGFIFTTVIMTLFYLV